MLERKLGIILLVATSLLAVANLVTGQYWTAALSAAVSGYLIWRMRTDGPRKRAAAAAKARWSPERVREATAGAQGHVPAVKALREADPALSLTDADRLVKAARPT